VDYVSIYIVPKNALRNQSAGFKRYNCVVHILVTVQWPHS